MQSYDVVVVGCGVAAGYFCRELVERNYKRRVLVIGDEPHLPYERPALTKGYLINKGIDVANFYTCVGSGGTKLDHEFYKKNGIHFKFNTKVTGIDFGDKVVSCDNDEKVKANHAIVLGMGSRSTRLEDFRMPVEHIKSGIHYIRDIADTDRLIAHASSLPRGSNIVILGGGYIGMESAAGLIKYGHKITMVFPEPKVMDRFMTQRLADFYESRYRSAGVTILKGDLASGLLATAHGAVNEVKLKSGKSLSADLVIVGVGARPNVELAKDELEIHKAPPGGVIVNDDMTTSMNNVLVIGELAALKSKDGTINRFEHVHYARQTAMRAARTLAAMDGTISDPDSPFIYEPYFYSRVLNLGWVLYGQTPPADKADVHYQGDMSELGDSKFAAFWVCNQARKVVGAFMEGGSSEENADVKRIVSQGASWPLKTEFLPKAESPKLN